MGTWPDLPGPFPHSVRAEAAGAGRLWEWDRGLADHRRPKFESSWRATRERPEWEPPLLVSVESKLGVLSFS